MTQEQYEQDMKALNDHAAKILKSPETTRQFLIDAGLWLGGKPKKKQRRSPTKKKTE